MTTLERICALYRRQGDLRRETAYRWLVPAEVAELIDIQVELNTLWPRRQRELAGASESARIKADAAMRAGRAPGQGRRTDLVGELT